MLRRPPHILWHAGAIHGEHVMSDVRLTCTPFVQNNLLFSRQPPPKRCVALKLCTRFLFQNIIQLTLRKWLELDRICHRRRRRRKKNSLATFQMAVTNSKPINYYLFVATIAIGWQVKEATTQIAFRCDRENGSGERYQVEMHRGNMDQFLNAKCVSASERRRWLTACGLEMNCRIYQKKPSECKW